MIFLTPLGGLAALAALIPIAAIVAGRGRVAAVRSGLGLMPPPRVRVVRQAAAVAAIAAIALAATQPALSDVVTARTRTNVEVLFVLDTSGSMAASATARSPTRLDRAVAAAERLRAEIPTVPAGIATMTDRVLPDLFPVTDVAAFDSVLTHAVAIEDPPAVDTSVRITTYEALEDIGTGNYFQPNVTRVVVLLTDGESLPIDPGEITLELSPSFGYRFLAVRFWAADEGVYGANGRREAAYHLVPAGKVILAQLAAALGGRSYEEADLGGAAAYLHHLVGSGTTARTRRGASVRTLAPFVAGVALLLLILALAPTPSELRSRRSRSIGRAGRGVADTESAGSV
ncbi:MAG: vWA domain-containing protein [Solirubrobacteraceae bacterium]